MHTCSCTSILIKKNPIASDLKMNELMNKCVDKPVLIVSEPLKYFLFYTKSWNNFLNSLECNSRKYNANYFSVLRYKEILIYIYIE